MRILSRFATSRDERRSTTALLEQEGRRGGAVVTTNGSGFYRACWVPTDTPLRIAVLDSKETLVPGRDNKGQLLANVAAVTERVVTISLEEPHATLDLRAERRVPSDSSPLS